MNAPSNIYATMRCDFCGKLNGAVGCLVSGPEVFICNECVIRCIDTTEMLPAPNVTEVGVRETEPRCSFCGEYHHIVGHLVGGPSSYICDSCLELAHDILAEKKLVLPRVKAPAECSFCDDRSSIVRIIEGPGVNICTRCVRQFDHFLTDEAVKGVSLIRQKCSFCGQELECLTSAIAVTRMSAASTKVLCVDCLSLCKQEAAS